MFTETLKERQAVAFAPTTTINSGGTTELATPGINMGRMRRIRGFFLLGTIANAGTVSISLQASASENSGYANMTNSTTNPTVTGITTDNSLNCLEIRADQLPDDTNWVRAYATTPSAENSVVSIVLIADEAVYKPGNQFNESTITNDVVTVT